MTPSNMSGALPTTTASMSPSRDRRPRAPPAAASRTRPAIETSSRLDVLRSGPRRSLRSAPPSAITLQGAHQVLLQARPRRGVRHGRARPARTRWPGRDSPMRISPADIMRVGRQRAARGVDRDVIRPAPGRRRRISSWWANGACSSATSSLLGVHPGASRLPSCVEGDTVRSRAPSDVGLDAVVDAGDAGGALAQLAGPVPAARTTAAQPSVIGGRACRRNGATS